MTSLDRHAGRALPGAALALALLAAAPPAEPAAGWPAPAGRDLQYLETGLGQLQRLEKRIKRLDEDRLGAGALAAAALATAGRPTGGEAARWTTAVLDACGSRWHRLQCQHAEMALQRIALQYPRALPPPLLARVRAEAVAGAPPPPATALRDPWSFKETENQRVLLIARNLGAQALAGTPDSAAARGWADYAVAFLAAHDRDGWYEAESPGYLASSITSLLHLADHAPQQAVRELAVRQLNLLFARWAQEQVGGFPAGVKSRTYVHWALGHRNTAWRAWAWLTGVLASPDGISFMDWPELPASGYELPAPVVELAAERRRQAPYEVKARRRIDLGERQDLDVALYSYATPDYILGAAQAVGRLRLSVSGGQEILATLFPECGFAPLYLWSRSENPRRDRWRSWADQDLAVGHRNVVLARLGRPGAVGHAYFAPGWSRPELAGGEAGEVVFARCGDAYVALVTAGGWEVAPAFARLPAYYGGDKAYRDAWVAVPRVQPARVALEAGRREEDGPFERFRERLAGARLADVDGELRYRSAAGLPLAYRPGERASAGERAIDASAYPPLEGPFLSRRREGGWRFAWKAVRLTLPELAPMGRAPDYNRASPR